MLSNRRRKHVCNGLAAAFLAGDWEQKGMSSRCEAALGQYWPPVRSLIERVLQRWSEPPPLDRLAEALVADAELQRAMDKPSARGRIVHWFPGRPAMSVTRWPVPPLTTVRELARWLNTTVEELDWLADCNRLGAQPRYTSRCHYRRHWLRKPTGAWRLVEAPKALLKHVQRRVLNGILDHVPPHSAACGFRKGRSVLQFTQPHVGQAILLTMDLHDYFPSVPASRVHALFRSLGYPRPVCRCLTGLCTTVTPAAVCLAHPDGRHYRARHLPQGAPTSPALANLCSFRLDCRLAALADTSGLTYTRYADDLAFSSAASRSVESLMTVVSGIAQEEGFSVHHRKTRVMRRGVRQRLAGLVVNARPNVPRDEYDRLKAILTNCRRHGPESQNRAAHPNFRAHLLGRVAYVTHVNPARGARLQTICRLIDWTADEV